MIISMQGTVRLSKVSKELIETLGISEHEAEILVEAGLGADLTGILSALIECYGIDKAFQLWQGAVEVYIETEKMKGDK